MSKGVGSGDKLARGAARAQFMTTEGGVSQDKWAQAFDDFDPEAFKKNAEQERSGDAGMQASGDAGADVAEIGTSVDPR